jgi:putative PIN family toxin of toxin-antitoxin system
MHRIVLDTNVLVAAAYAENSASRQIVEACLRGDLVAVASLAVKDEYQFILARAVRKPDYEPRLAELLEGMEMVQPDQSPRVVLEDAADDKFLAAALAGRAEWIVTNDRHLLALDPYDYVRIVPSGVFADKVLSTVGRGAGPTGTDTAQACPRPRH